MEGRSREGSLRRTMAEYGEVLDLDERKPGSGNWLDANVAQVGEEGQFANSFLYLEQVSQMGILVGTLMVEQTLALIKQRERKWLKFQNTCMHVDALGCAD